MKPLLNNAAFLVKLKGYDFICGSLKMTSNCDSISLGSFAPMDEESNAFKEMKRNNDETNMERQLGHKGERCTKASTKVWCDWKLNSWFRMLQLLQNANMDILFWCYRGAPLSEGSSGNSLSFVRPYICVRLEHLYRILACEKVKKWARDTSKCHKHLPFTVATRIQTILGKFWAACSDLSNQEAILKDKTPARNGSLFQQVDSSFNSLINDICKAQESDNAGQLSFPPCTYALFCAEEKPNKRKREDSVSPERYPHTDRHQGSNRYNQSDRNGPKGNEGKKSKWTEHKSDRNSKDEAASKAEGIWKLTGHQMPQVKDTVPPFVEFEDRRRPPCMKGGTKGLFCLYDKCNFHHLKNRKDFESLSANDRSTLEKYTSREKAIEWCIEAKSKKSSFKEKVKIEAVEVDSSSTEDEDVTAFSKMKISPVKKSKKKVTV